MLDSPTTVAWLIRLGRGQVTERLLQWDPTPGVKKLRMCDISLQEKYCKEAIPVFVLDDGNPSHVLVMVNSMTKEQVRQVFDGHRIRSLDEQCNWMRSQKPKAINVAALKSPYTIHKGKITFNTNPPITMTVAQLAQALAEASSRV